MRKYLLFIYILLLFGQAAARGIYQAPEDFLNDVYGGEVPRVSKYWIPRDSLPEIRAILGHDPGALRLSYWQHEERTAWVLEEIGKSEPITVGIVVNDDRIEDIRVLTFRESRGWEIRYPFFTDQFTNARIEPDGVLSTNIDGISGATLSVNAMKKLAVFALYLHRQVSQ